MEKGVRVSNKRKEWLFLGGASVLTICIALYLFWLVHLLVDKADQAFKNTPPVAADQLRFNFEKYNQILQAVGQKK